MKKPGKEMKIYLKLLLHEGNKIITLKKIFMLNTDHPTVCHDKPPFQLPDQ